MVAVRVRGRPVLCEPDGHVPPADDAPAARRGGDAPAPGDPLHGAPLPGRCRRVPPGAGARREADARLPLRPALHVRRVHRVVHVRRARWPCDGGDGGAPLPLRAPPGHPDGRGAVVRPRRGGAGLRAPLLPDPELVLPAPRGRSVVRAPPLAPPSLPTPEGPRGPGRRRSAHAGHRLRHGSRELPSLPRLRPGVASAALRVSAERDARSSRSVARRSRASPANTASESVRR